VGSNEHVGWTDGGLQWPICGGKASALLKGVLSQPDANGEGVASMEWWTHVEGGDFSAYMGLTGHAEVSLSQVSKKAEDADLTFLWVTQETHTPYQVRVTTKVNYPGQWIKQNVDGLPIEEGVITQASLTPQGSISVDINEVQECSNCNSPKTEGQFVRLHYKVISPEFCDDDPSSSLLDPKHSGLDAIQSLVCAFPATKHGVSIDDQWAKRGSALYPKIAGLENYLKVPAQYPVLSKLAAIQLNRFWSSAAHLMAAQEKSDADYLTLAAQLLARADDDHSILRGLLQAKASLKDSQARKKVVDQVLDQVSSLQSDVSQDYAQMIRETLDEPELLTADDMNELILGTLAVGSDLLDEAQLRGVEADLYAAKARQ
jgi:hypothetical protein